jgi:GNAT superfamily N-acetyltransferase
MYHIEEVLPDANEYQMLRTAVGWASPSEAACQQALDGTSFGVVARHAERIVGMGRLVGDAAMYSFIVDVVVHPDHQGAGLGRRMVDALVNWSNTRHPHDSAHRELGCCSLLRTIWLHIRPQQRHEVRP